MELYAIRHGESEANRDKAYAGQSQAALTDLGKQQAAEVRRELAGIRFDAVFSSDLLRARQTTEIVLPGTPYRAEDRLREIDVGLLCGRRVADCPREFGERYVSAAERFDFTGFGGESEDDVRARVAEFMDSLSEFDDSAKIAVICHAGTITAMMSYVSGVPVERRTVWLGNCSVTRFCRRDGRWELES